MKFLALIVLLISTGLSACSAEPARPAYPEIPRMPEALEEKAMDGGFEYLVPARLSEVEAFYVTEMQAAGWQYRGLGEGIGGIFLTFEKEFDLLSISAYRERDEPYARVEVRMKPALTAPSAEG